MCGYNYIVTMKDGTRHHVLMLDGGGCWVGTNKYEVHGTTADDEFFCVFQDEIESVVDFYGKEFADFGNPLFPGHPYADKRPA